MSLFFGISCQGKIGCNRLQYTFLDKLNTFLFMNFAQKLTVTYIQVNMHPQHIPLFYADYNYNKTAYGKKEKFQEKTGKNDIDI
jgi:hypothetical protein